MEQTATGLKKTAKKMESQLLATKKS